MLSTLVMTRVLPPRVLPPAPPLPSPPSLTQHNQSMKPLSFASCQAVQQRNMSTACAHACSACAGHTAAVCTITAPTQSLASSQDVSIMLVLSTKGFVTDSEGCLVQGKGSREQGNLVVKEAVAAMMHKWNSAFRCGASAHASCRGMICSECITHEHGP